jgi:peroxiredoxin Q/BCP
MPKPSPLPEGSQAPEFSFSENGSVVSSRTMDRPCLLYFYPKDDTPGCTKQACGIRDQWARFEEVGLRVVGVSKDDEASHGKFIGKYALPFPLIADPDLKLATAFGVFGEKKFMGKVYDGVHRMSFLISAEGKILKTYDSVKPEQHADTVLEDLATLSS